MTRAPWELFMGWLTAQCGQPRREVLRRFRSSELTRMRAYFHVFILGKKPVPEKSTSLGDKVLAFFGVKK